MVRFGTSAANRVMGGILVGLGVVALGEGVRLHALRTMLIAGAVVGDDTFPLLTGAVLVPLGIYAMAGRLVPVSAAPLPGSARTRMLWGAGLLAAYWTALPYLGYTAATALASTALFRAMGGYGWPAALLLGAGTTGAFHLIFRVWLVQPLPAGVLGF
jgi:hypothetical protein